MGIEEVVLKKVLEGQSLTRREVQRGPAEGGRGRTHWFHLPSQAGPQNWPGLASPLLCGGLCLCARVHAHVNVRVPMRVPRGVCMCVHTEVCTFSPAPWRSLLAERWMGVRLGEGQRWDSLR